MKNFIEEFKAFINRGNVMDMAVGVIIGGAFTSIVTSLVDDIINPIIGLVGGMNFTEYKIMVGAAEIKYGSFITAAINFIIMAFVVFIMMNAINKATGKLKKPTEEVVTTKVCPYCKSEINIEATRCPHCTSQL